MGTSVVTVAGSGSGLGTKNSETNTYKSNRLNTSGYVSDFELSLIDSFISKGKAAGWWNSIIEWYPFLGNTASAVSVKGKYPSTASATLTITGFTDADFNDVSEGFGISTETNSSKYASSNVDLVASGLSQTNLFIAVNCLNNNTSLAYNDFGFPLAIENTNTANNYILAMTMASGGFEVEYGTSYDAGLVSVNYGASKRSFYKNNILRNENSGAKTGFLTTTWGTGVKLFRQTYNGAARYGTGRIGTVVISSALTDAQIISINSAILNFDYAIGRDTPIKELVTFGDSITAGAGVSNTRNGAETWANKLSRRLGLKLNNLGVGGSRLVVDSNSPAYVAGLTNYVNVFNKHLKKLVVLYGPNDCGIGTPSSTFGTNLNNLLGGLTANPYSIGKDSIIVCSIPYRTPGGSYTLALQQEYLEQARAKAVSNGCVFVDLWGPFYSKTTLGTTVLADGLHPNNTGHQLIFDLICEAIKEDSNRNFIGVARGIDLNVTNTDRAIHVYASSYKVSKIVISSPSADISGSALTASIRDASGGGGNAIVSTVSKTGLTASTKSNEQTVESHDILTGDLYFRVGTSHGSAACVDVFIYGEVLY